MNCAVYFILSRCYNLEVRMKNKKKWLISFLIVFVISCGSFGAVIADTSITGMLSSWLTNKSDEAIQEIDKEILEEQAVQTERLKAELDESLEKLNGEMNAFIEAEKEKRVLALQGYADKLIAEMDINEADQKAEIEREIERIYREASQEIEQLKMKIEIQSEEEHEETGE